MAKTLDEAKWELAEVLDRIVPGVTLTEEQEAEYVAAVDAVAVAGALRAVDELIGAVLA